MQLSHFHFSFFFLNCSFMNAMLLVEYSQLPYFVLSPYIAKTMKENFVSYRFLFCCLLIEPYEHCIAVLHVSNFIDSSISYILSQGCLHSLLISLIFVCVTASLPTLSVKFVWKYCLQVFSYLKFLLYCVQCMLVFLWHFSNAW